MDTGISTTLLSGVLKVKLPDTKQNLMKSPWRDRLCVLEESGNNNSDFKIFKANTTKSTSKLYQSVSLCGSTSVWKDSNPKSATFYLRESGKQGEIACLCSSFEECNQWVEAIQKKIQTLNHQTMLTMQHDSSLSMKQPKEDEKSMSEHDSIRSAPSDSAFLTEARNSQEIIGGHIEPIRIQKSRNLTNAPIFAPTTPESIGQSTVAQVHPNTAKLISSSIRPEGLDIPLFTSPMSSNHTPAISVPFWLNLESGTPAGEPGVDLKSHRALQLSPVRKDFNPLESMKLELSELTQLNNSLYQKIETLQEEKRVTLAELENERSLYQQRVEDLKTRNLLTNEECRSLHEDIYRLKTELKDLRTRYEEEILKTSTESTIHQQLETYRQLSESLTKENIKLSTDIAKLGRQMSDHENSEKKSASTIKLLLEKNSHLENEQLRLQESFDHLNRAHTELLREKDELNNKYQALSSKHKRSEIELRKLQGRFHEEIQSEVHAEAERMTLLEEECSRLQTEIFTTKNERNQWELENIRLNEELAKLKATVESMNVSQHVELVQQMELLRDNLLKSQQDNEELRRLLQEKGKEREDLTTRLESLKCDAKEWKKASKQQLIDAEAKISKMQTEILRLVSSVFREGSFSLYFVEC